MAPNERLQDNGGSPQNRRARSSDQSSTTDVGAAQSGQRSGDDADARPPYESPLNRVRLAVARATNKRVIETVGELKDYIDIEDALGRGVPASAAAGIALRMRLVWTSFETCSTGDVARLHCVDKCVKDSVAEMHEVFKDDYATKKSIVDSEMVTVSLYGVSEATAGLPDDGAIILVSRIWSLKMFMKQSCQLSTSLDSIKVDG